MLGPVGVNHFLAQTCTITVFEHVPMQVMQFSVNPVLGLAVEAMNSGGRQGRGVQLSEAQASARYLADSSERVVTSARKIWCLGPGGSSPDILTDVTKDSAGGPRRQHLHLSQAVAEMRKRSGPQDGSPARPGQLLPQCVGSQQHPGRESARFRRSQRGKAREFPSRRRATVQTRRCAASRFLGPLRAASHHQH
ncbi:hypothetical protein CB1_000954004 [Camelus ferus]|nr:hypothetical protein CB1_000954004 [Camelus ferus]